MNQQTQTTKLSLNVEFLLEGAEFPESLIETLSGAVELAIQRASQEGQLTPDENEAVDVRLNSIIHSKPAVNVILNNGRVDRVVTNDKRLVINVFDEAGDAQANECYSTTGKETYVYTSTCVDVCAEVSDKWQIEATAYQLFHEDEFVDTAVEELTENRPKLLKRVVDVETDPDWLIEKAYEAFVVIGGEEYLLYRFASKLELDVSVAVWEDILKRL